jgi:polysaccharide export outer membrane protein
VIVTVPKSAANAATISGEVVNGARIALSPKGDRLMDMIAAAGGAKAPVYETFVRLSRDGATATIPLERLIADPAENIYAWPGDVLTLVQVPRSFTAFGATGKNAEIDFGAERLTLIQALAKSSGLLDQRADPAGVFLFRIEPGSLVAALEPGTQRPGGSAAVPVVFHLDLSDAKSYFLAERFPVADQDILYVANASSNDLQKFFQLLGTLTSPIVTGIVLQNSVP